MPGQVREEISPQNMVQTLMPFIYTSQCEVGVRQEPGAEAEV